MEQLARACIPKKPNEASHIRIANIRRDSYAAPMAIGASYQYYYRAWSLVGWSLAGWLLLGLLFAACSDDAPANGSGDTATGETDVSGLPGSDAADGLDMAEADAAPDLPQIGVTFTEERAACLDRNPERNVYYGDLHVHTSLSFDAWAFSVRGLPEDAYAFAQGEPVQVSPLDEAGNGTVTVRIDRPLDFVAVTDHAEYLGEVSGCITEGTPIYDSRTCISYRSGSDLSVQRFGIRLTNPTNDRFSDICTDAYDCLAQAQSLWTRTQQAAEDAYDRTETCEFTTFSAYEYTGSTLVSNIHRNVIFRNAEVPIQPTTYFEEPTPQGLWAALDRDCLQSGTRCDVLLIPHNANWSNGRMFFPEYPEASSLEEERGQAQFRADMEPLVEIFQHKGDGECLDGFAGVFGAPDELCGYEKLRTLTSFDDCLDTVGGGAQNGTGCLSRYDFVRTTLLEGMREQIRLGANPYRLGILASTDTHNATPGFVSEDTYRGHQGDREDVPETRLGPGTFNPGGIIYNPGGLAGIWAEENSRDALFEALRRRETFGTSGPRLSVRFFGGWTYNDDLCGSADLVSQGYEGGVSMGGILSDDVPADGAPHFVVSALRDPDVERVGAAPLERVQIVKGWITAEGEMHQQVFDVAGEAGVGQVDPDTCVVSGGGFDSLCAVWRDPDFDPAQHAFYYVRVLETPTCRWSNYLCNSLTQVERPETCSDPTVARTGQERAWTSPIWYEPQEVQ